MGESVQQKIIQGIKVHLARQFSLPMEQLEMMIPGFISTLETHMRNLDGALLDNDPQLLGRAGHTIKGAFLNLGLEDCASIAIQIEERGRAGDKETDFKALVEELRLKIAPILE
jgi:HPt (histidine-containing phosphotransfer) domain-containing protein